MNDVRIFDTGQSVKVHTARGWVVVAHYHYYESLDYGTPFLTHEDMFQMLEVYRKLRPLAPTDAHIVPGHDPAVLERYPAPSPELAGIVARLDAAPTE